MGCFFRWCFLNEYLYFDTVHLSIEKKGNTEPILFIQHFLTLGQTERCDDVMFPEYSRVNSWTYPLFSMDVYCQILGLLSKCYFKGTILTFIAFSVLLFTRNVTLDAFSAQ